MADFELGYAIGLLVGEGSFTQTTRNYYDWPRISVCMYHDPEPVHLLQRVFGGAVHGPYARGEYFWYLNNRTQINPVLPILMAHMPPSRKRDQMLVWAEKWRPYFDGEKGWRKR